MLYQGTVTSKVTKTVEADSVEAAQEALNAGNGTVVEGTEAVEVTEVAEQA